MAPEDAPWRNSLRKGSRPTWCSSTLWPSMGPVTNPEVWGKHSYFKRPKSVPLITGTSQWLRATKNTHLSPGLWRLLTLRQRSWLVDGAYLQVGFYDPTVIEVANPFDGIAIAMTLYDSFVDRTGQLNPIYHLGIDPSRGAGAAKWKDPLPIVNGYRVAVNSIFEIGLGIWSRQLVALRNTLLIEARARALGRNPKVELDKFKRAGHTYFLQHDWT